MACACLLWQVTALGQTAATSGSLTLAQAEAIALQNHPQIAAAVDEAGAAGRHVVEAKAPLYPTISGEVTGSQARYGSRLGAGALTDSLLFSRFGSGLQANQLITDFGRTANLIASSRLQQQAAEQTVTATRYDVALDVNRAFFGVLQAEAYVKVAEDTVQGPADARSTRSALWRGRNSSRRWT